MSDLFRSMLLFAGLGIGTLTGYFTGGKDETPAARGGVVAALEAQERRDERRAGKGTDLSELSVSDDAAGGDSSPAPMFDKLAGWWQRALTAKPGDGEALILEMERETGGSLLPTMIAVLAQHDPEGCLRAILKLQELRLPGDNDDYLTNHLLRHWVIRDPGAAQKAAASLPTAHLRKEARRAMQFALERAEESDAPPDHSAEASDADLLSKALMALKGNSDADFGELAALRGETLAGRMDLWLAHALSFDPERAARLFAKTGEEGRKTLMEMAVRTSDKEALLHFALRVLPAEAGMELRARRAGYLAGIRSTEDNVREAHRQPAGSAERSAILRTSLQRMKAGSREARQFAAASQPGDLDRNAFNHAAFPDDEARRADGLLWLAGQSPPAARVALLAAVLRQSPEEMNQFLAAQPAGEARDACLRRFAARRANAGWLKSLPDADYAMAATAIRADLSQPEQVHDFSIQFLEKLGR